MGLSDHQLDRLRDLVDRPDLSETPYELLDRVAVGGMGTVFRARDTRLDRTVAIKVLTAPDAEGRLAARMQREAKVVARLEHPGIVPIHDVGQLPDGRVFYAMKFVEGQTLENVHAQFESRTDRLRAFQKICEAVSFAHARGVIHRDLKPSNIMVGPFGEVLVMDWGIAALNDGFHEGGQSDERSVQDSIAPGRTADGVVMGTPGYMSPEQAKGENARVDHRADIYGLGAILYFLLTGQAPPTTAAAPSARAVERDVPKQLDAIAAMALAGEPSDRYQSAEMLATDIAQFLDGHPVAAYGENIWEKSVRWLGRNRFIAVMVLAYIIARIIIFFLSGI